MTGYGKAEIKLENINISIEIKSLNSKQLDSKVKISSIYREKEVIIRRLLSEKLQRGKIELSIWREKLDSNLDFTLNNNVISKYYQQVVRIEKELGLNFNDPLASLLKMPNALIKNEEKSDKEEWNKIIEGINIAIKDLLQFRIVEGNKLEHDISLRIESIGNLLNELKPYANNRIKTIKKSLYDKLVAIEGMKIDENRLEQELIYYIEKQDITEEQVRLDAHLCYFKETMKTNSPNGKKLAFIAQEIGREVNTIGSKSSDYNMQKIVVQMKDELEKVKEQLLNIL
tara:strand:- start:32474 stop:33331 length:858 start_codon:yes stop_codon:yes gene_type:complete